MYDFLQVPIIHERSYLVKFLLYGRAIRFQTSNIIVDLTQHKASLSDIHLL